MYTGGCRDNCINVLKPMSKFEKQKSLKVASGL